MRAKSLFSFFSQSARPEINASWWVFDHYLVRYSILHRAEGFHYRRHQHIGQRLVQSLTLFN